MSETNAARNARKRIERAKRLMAEGVRIADVMKRTGFSAGYLKEISEPKELPASRGARRKHADSDKEWVLCLRRKKFTWAEVSIRTGIPYGTVRNLVTRKTKETNE